MKQSYLIILLFTIMISSCQQANKKVEYKKFVKTGEAQGSYYSITYYDSLGRDFGHEIEQLLHDFDQSCSNYQAQSIISKVNRNEELALDSLFIGNFIMAQMVSKETNGDFDISVRPLVELWGFGLKNKQKVSKEQVDSIMEFVGYQLIRLENGEIIKSDPRVTIDYNAIAQGYSVDVMSKFLESKGIKSYLVDIGGELFARSTKIGGEAWKVGIELPADSAKYGENLSAIIRIRDIGMATSGNYRKFYITDGIKYAHTINPHTGYPVQHSLLSATVLAPNAGLADAYATAFMVMGVEKAKLVLARHPELKVYLIYADVNGDYKAFVSSGLNDMLEENSLQ
ncbi:MAG: FAD:protein FMN transferase [Bacteroidales bacterium]|nr:FAD:protein FMN transferase [Bacteroidales bacterium]